MNTQTEQFCFCALSRDATGTGDQHTRSAVSTHCATSSGNAEKTCGAGLQSPDSGARFLISQPMGTDGGVSSPMDALCLQARLRRDVSGCEQVMVLLDLQADETPSDMNVAVDRKTKSEITWITLCQADCLLSDHLCLALSSGFDRVYLQLSADTTRLKGQLQQVEAASARLRPGQVLRLFHSVDGLLGGWAEPPARTDAPLPAASLRKAGLAISGTDCTYCGQCAWVCPTGALHHGDGLLSVEDAACVACGLCVAMCPTRALSLVERDVDTMPKMSS